MSGLHGRSVPEAACMYLAGAGDSAAMRIRVRIPQFDDDPVSRASMRRRVAASLRGRSPAGAACRAPPGARSAPSSGLALRARFARDHRRAHDDVALEPVRCRRRRRSARWWRSPCRGSRGSAAAPRRAPTKRSVTSALGSSAAREPSGAAGRGDGARRIAARTRTDSARRRRASGRAFGLRRVRSRRRRRCAAPADGARRLPR